MSETARNTNTVHSIERNAATLWRTTYVFVVRMAFNNTCRDTLIARQYDNFGNLSRLPHNTSLYYSLCSLRLPIPLYTPLYTSIYRPRIVLVGSGSSRCCVTDNCGHQWPSCYRDLCRTINKTTDMRLQLNQMERLFSEYNT
jgi:hypothetical protein